VKTHWKTKTLKNQTENDLLKRKLPPRIHWLAGRLMCRVGVDVCRVVEKKCDVMGKNQLVRIAQD
jgi:hypothetical protein